MEAIVLEGQSLLDLAIQMGGSVESLFDLAVENNLSITGVIAVGAKLYLASVANKRIAEYYALKNLTPATDAPNASETGAGIGYMTIDIDFIVGG